MIAGDIVYLRPGTAEEAVAAWATHEGARYLAGGTEIVTAARRAAAPDLRACIDLKRIPEAAACGTDGGVLCLGAATPLSDLADRGDFPLLAAVCRGIADRTVRNRLTLGGNLAGLLPYREAALPLLLADATLRTILPGRDGAPAVRRERRLRESFDKRLLLAPGELVLSFAVPLAATQWPWRHHRRTRTGPVDYPLVTLALVRDGPAVRFAVAGAHPYPFRSDAVDAALSRDGAGAVPAVVDALGPLRADARASAEYRAYLLGHLLRASLEELA